MKSKANLRLIKTVPAEAEAAAEAGRQGKAAPEFGAWGKKLNLSAPRILALFGLAVFVLGFVSLGRQTSALGEGRVIVATVLYGGASLALASWLGKQTETEYKPVEAEVSKITHEYNRWCVSLYVPELDRWVGTTLPDTANLTLQQKIWILVGIKRRKFNPKVVDSVWLESLVGTGDNLARVQLQKINR